MVYLFRKTIIAVKNQIIKDKKIIFASLAIGLVFTVAAGLYTKSYAEKTSASIAENIIRFHVLANSDSDVDQALKASVRDAVIEKYSEELSTSASIEESRGILVKNLVGIQELAQKVVNEQGFNYTVSASISKDSFPTKNYGDITLPAGTYEALRIEIGVAEGQNWWCVMFPPLCFVDASKNEIDPEAKEMLKNMLSEEEYMLIANNLREENVPVKVKFKIIEWWQEKNNNGESEEIIIVKTPEKQVQEGSF